MSIDYSNFAFPKPEKVVKIKKKMKNKSKKQAKLERNRYSILTDDLEHCFACELERKKSKREDLHEVFGGRNRRKSIEYGLVVPLCRKCHDKATNDIEFYKKLQEIAKEEFIYRYGKEKFLEEFK